MFITRDKARTEDDDWKLNVQPNLDKTKESVPIYDPPPTGQIGFGTLIGCKIQNKFE